MLASRQCRHSTVGTWRAMPFLFVHLCACNTLVLHETVAALNDPCRHQGSSSLVGSSLRVLLEAQESAWQWCVGVQSSCNCRTCLGPMVGCISIQARWFCSPTAASTDSSPLEKAFKECRHTASVCLLRPYADVVWFVAAVCDCKCSGSLCWAGCDAPGEFHIQTRNSSLAAQHTAPAPSCRSA
jgi:hypothetical protein